MDDVVHIADETVRKAATSTRLQATRIRECRVFTLPDERNIVKYAGPWKSVILTIYSGIRNKNSFLSSSRRITFVLITPLNYLPTSIRATYIGAIFNLFFR